MAIIARNAFAPFTDGETATDTTTALEADFATVHADFNGNMTNANFKALAAIAGSKFKSSSIANDRVTASVITLASMAASSVPKHHTDVDGTGSLTKLNSSLEDIPGITEAVLTPGSTNDMIFCDLSVEYEASSNPSESGTIVVGFNINTTEFDNVITINVPSNGAFEQPLHSTYSLAAPSASSMTIKPGIKYSGSKTVSIVSAQFRCFILPGKA